MPRPVWICGIVLGSLLFSVDGPSAVGEPVTLAPPLQGETVVPNQPADVPPHWLERRAANGETSAGGEHTSASLFADPSAGPARPTGPGELYLRIDGGAHRETGFPQREGVGFELDGRLYLPSAPWLSVIGELRNEVLSGDDRLSWTVGGISEFGPLHVAAGVDGIYDTDSDSHVGSGFIMISHELAHLNSRIGLWSTFELWDDIEVTIRERGPFVVEFIESGVRPYEQTSIFYSARLGLDGEWGELYLAPGFEHTHGRFRISTGYQVTIFDGPDLFVHYGQTASGDRDWSVFAGVQFHFGGGPARPFDFTMPQRLRARQVRETVHGVFVFEPF